MKPAVRWLRRVSPGHLAGVASLLMAAGAPALADPAAQAAEAIAAAAQPRELALQPEVSTVHTKVANTMVPALQQADGRTMDQLAGVDYRVWMQRGRTAVALGVGTLGYVQQPAFDRRGGDGPMTLANTAPTVSVALRMRMSPESAVYADATGSRGFGPAPDPFVNTKVGIEWKPAKSRFGFDGSRLALQLDSGYKVSLRARKGGIGVYVRGQF